MTRRAFPQQARLGIPPGRCGRDSRLPQPAHGGTDSPARLRTGVRRARMDRTMRIRAVPFLTLMFAGATLCPVAPGAARGAPGKTMKITITFDRGHDVGQAFGSLFEATSEDGALVLGAGFQNGYNTRFRADRHAVQFFVRPTEGPRTFTVDKLPRPNNLCGTYLYGRDGVVYSTYGGLKSWNPAANTWREVLQAKRAKETMRVGKGLLEFGDSTVRYNGRIILTPPDEGGYQSFFYAEGQLCFYHVKRGQGGYRPYQSEEDGFSKLYACPWTPEDDEADLANAVVLLLPVVGETTFTWGQLGEQIVTGSNVGGFYVFEKGTWHMLLKPTLGVSYQLYSTTVFRDRLLMGQYPTGHLFTYDGKTVTELAGWPPKLAGVSGAAREAQTTVIYGGDVFVGVWPWAELWRYNPGGKTWTFMRRMFDHPRLSEKVTHPYEVENARNAPGNQWGQRVTSLVTLGPDLFISTSAKWPCEWDATKFSFLAPDKWKAYGAVYRMTMPGHLAAPTRWTDGPTTLEFVLAGARVSLVQDGVELASTTFRGGLANRLRAISKLEKIHWGRGIYGRFSGPSLSGSVHDE